MNYLVKRFSYKELKTEDGGIIYATEKKSKRIIR